MNQLYTIEDYLKNAIKSFEGDPADTPYQEGYLAALQELLSEINRMKNSA